MAARVERHDSNRHTFLRNVQQTIDYCVRISSSDASDDVTVNNVIDRLTVLRRNILDVTNHILEQSEADELVMHVEGLRNEVSKKLSDFNVPEDTSYHAQRTEPSAGGSPRYNISTEQLQFLANYNFTAAEMAQTLHTSEPTIRRRLSQYNIGLRGPTSISDEDLDEHVRRVIGTNQKLGPNSIRVRLFQKDVAVSRQRVRDSCHRVDPAGCAMRSAGRRNIVRRTYKVAGPNSLWHLDGNHKLIRWQMVIHGCIDGFSRHINFLEASDNNRSLTVFDKFVKSTRQFGVPSRVRVDQGVENNDVCVFMEGCRGEGRGSAIRGKSCHNQRIERLWVDIWDSVSNEYYDLFVYMEDRQLLDISNPDHRWALCYVFIPRLNHSLNTFVYQYNNHKLSTEHSKTPNQLFIAGVFNHMHANMSAVNDYLFLAGNHDDGSFTEDIMEEEDPDIDGHVDDDVEQYSPIQADQLERLQAEVNVLHNKDNIAYGLEVFREVCHFLNTL